MVRENKPIRTLILGDQSKFHFLKEIMHSSSWNEIWHKRKDSALLHMLIEVEEKEREEVSEVFFGDNSIRLKGKLPQGTALLYLPEGTELRDVLLFSDRFVFFDEFPFRERELLGTMKNISSLYPLYPIMVVLYHPERKQLITDITSVETAATEAKEIYENESICAEIHVPGNQPDFLYWKKAEVFSKRREALKEEPKAVRKKIEKYGHFELEILIQELNALVDVNELERFIRFSSGLTGKNLYGVFVDRFLKSHLSAVHTDFMKAVQVYYTYFMQPLCIWPTEADNKMLLGVLSRYWENYQESGKGVSFHGTSKIDYYDFLRETKVGYNFKVEVSRFINNEIPILLNQYIERNIRFFEEIVHE